MTKNAILRIGSRNDQVAQLQRWLLKHGYFTEPSGRDLSIDGIFGPKTQLAVLAAQRDSGIHEDGIVGPTTLARMKAREESQDTDVNPRYRDERGNPKLPNAIGLSLLFDGKTLILRGPGKFAHYSAASGMPVQKSFDYSRNAQQNLNTGPIPEGTYWVQPDELWRNRWWSPRRRSSWGNYALSIHPFYSTVTFGRGGFFIHGGDQLGSKGCIDLAQGMDRFVQDLMEAISFQPKCSILLRVKYGTPGN